MCRKHRERQRWRERDRQREWDGAHNAFLAFLEIALFFFDDVAKSQAKDPVQKLIKISDENACELRSRGLVVVLIKTMLIWWNRARFYNFPLVTFIQNWKDKTAKTKHLSFRPEFSTFFNLRPFWQSKFFLRTTFPNKWQKHHNVTKIWRKKKLWILGCDRISTHCYAHHFLISKNILCLCIWGNVR